MKPTNDNGLAAPRDQPVKTYTQDTNDFATGIGASKAASRLRAQLALAGHAVYPLKDGAFRVCKYGYTHHAIDLDGLHAFAVKLGLCRIEATEDTARNVSVDLSELGDANG